MILKYMFSLTAICFNITMVTLQGASITNAESLIDRMLNYKKDVLKIPGTSWNTIDSSQTHFFYYPNAPYEFTAPHTPADFFTFNNKIYSSLFSCYRSQRVSLTAFSTDLLTMYNIIKAKYTQYPHLQTLLINTNNSILIYNDPSNEYWSMGKQGSGFNYLGIIYMILRNEFTIKNRVITSVAIQKKMPQTTWAYSLLLSLKNKFSWLFNTKGT